MRGGIETQQHSEVQAKCGGHSSPSCSEKKPGWGAERRAGVYTCAGKFLEGQTLLTPAVVKEKSLILKLL